jgi:hypothetical protein
MLAKLQTAASLAAGPSVVATAARAGAVELAVLAVPVVLAAPVVLAVLAAATATAAATAAVTAAVMVAVTAAGESSRLSAVAAAAHAKLQHMQ